MRAKLALLMEQKGYTVTELAKRVGLSRAYLSQILNGQRNLTYEKAIDFLVRGFDFRQSEAEQLVQKWRLEEYGITDFPIGGETIRVPVLGTVSCGPLKSSDIIDYEDVGKEYIKGNSEDYFILKANGISMTGHIHHGDHVLVRKTKVNVPGNIMIFRFGTEYGSGFLQVKNGVLYIVKSNTEYPPIMLSSENDLNTEEFEIAGVVEAVVYRKLSR